jgi:ATP-dependent DNA ligase
MPVRVPSRLHSLPKTKAAFISPMECALVAKLPEGPAWTYEVKLDSYRAVAVKTSRDVILYCRIVSEIPRQNEAARRQAPMEPPTSQNGTRRAVRAVFISATNA